MEESYEKEFTVCNRKIKVLISKEFMDNTGYTSLIYDIERAIARGFYAILKGKQSLNIFVVVDSEGNKITVAGDFINGNIKYYDGCIYGFIKDYRIADVICTVYKDGDIKDMFGNTAGMIV